MRRELSIFPRGYPGTGLVLLRLAVAAGLPLLLPAGLPTQLVGVAYFAAGVAVLALLAGVLTTWVAGACWIIAIVVLSVVPAGAGMLAPMAFGLCSGALVLLGPGGYSVDALLFGRRVVRIRD